jgi:hypothetical protein
MITIADFDEVVLNNPFLKGENVGYGFNKLFWRYSLTYDPYTLDLEVQSNETCKYIIIESVINSTAFKIIREDDHIVVKEIFSDINLDHEKITDSKKLLKAEKQFRKLKKLIKKQTQKHNKTIDSLKEVALTFNVQKVREFLNLIEPTIAKADKEQIINELVVVQKNPLEYFNENLSDFDSEDKQLGKAIFSHAFISALEDENALFFIDWKSPHEEVDHLLSELFKKLNLPYNQKAKPSSSSNYQAFGHLVEVNKTLANYNFTMLNLFGTSDTVAIIAIKSKDYKSVVGLGKELGIEINEVSERLLS